MQRTPGSDILFHPVRFRIVQAFIGGGPLSAQEVMRWLPDVPQASLYRHLNALVESGTLVPVEERRGSGRGAAETVFDLSGVGDVAGPEDLSSATPADHHHYFMLFLAGVLWDFEQYLRRDRIDLATDRVSYRQDMLYLSDDEADDLRARIHALVRAASTNPPTPERTRRTLATIFLPVEDDEPDADVDG